MWIPPFLATPEAVQRQASKHSNELYSVGKACVELLKLAATPQSVYSLAGRLVGSKSGWLMLEVPNALVRGAFDALHEPGAELPPDLDAHISVIRPEELEQLGGLDKVTERGHFYKYQLGPVQSVNPQGWPEYSKCWFIRIRSPELEKLRKSYGLTAKPKNNEHDFHITVAVRKTTVLQPNEVSKAAEVVAHISGPMGAGKTTLLHELAKEHPHIATQDLDEFTQNEDPTHTPEEHWNKVQEKVDSYVDKNKDKPIVLAGHSFSRYGDYEAKMPAKLKLMLDTGVLKSTWRGFLRQPSLGYALRSPLHLSGNVINRKLLKDKGHEAVSSEEAKKRIREHFEKVEGHGKAGADSMGFVSGPSLAPDATDIDDPESQAIIDRPDELEHLNDTEPADNRPKGMGRQTTKWAAFIADIVARRHGLTKQASDVPSEGTIGHYKPKEKVTREAFGYLPPKGNHDQFAQCGTCRAWTGPEHETCMILGPKVEVTADMACNYYQHGNPSPAGAGKERAILTPRQAGAVKRQVRCENCAFFDKEESYCELFEHLGETHPDAFDLDTHVDPKGCCNFQVPKGEKIEEEAKEAALWYLQDELSKEKEAAANRISLTVIDPRNEKTAFDLKRVATGAIGAGGLGLGAAMLYQGLKPHGASWLEQGHQLWQEPENHERLTKALGDPSLAQNMISMAAQRPKIFRSMLAGNPVPDVDPATQRQVRELTFGQNKEHMKSQPGDLMLSGSRKGFVGQATPWATGSSAMHADVGGIHGGDWLGLWTWYAQHPKSTRALYKDNPSLRVAKWDVPPSDRYRIGLRPREDAAKPIDRQKFREWLTKQQHPFGEDRYADVALHEVLPELSYSGGHRLGLIGKLLARSKKVRGLFASSKMPQTYNKLIESGYSPSQAAEVCSSFAAKAIKKFSPGLIPNKHYLYSPGQLSQLANPGGPYRIHQIELPKNLATPEELAAEHKRVKWGPLLWRLPIAAGLLGGGGYLANKAWNKESADHRHGLACVKVKRRDHEVLVCPHCGKEVEEKDLYRDKKGWVFHRPCFAKGKGSIKLGASLDNAVPNRLRELAAMLDKRAFSGGLGSDPVSGMPVNDPPRPTQRDGSSDAAKITHVGSLFDTMAGTEETQIPLDDTGVSYRQQELQPESVGYQESSSVGAQGRTQAASAAGAGQEYGYPSGEAGMSAPAAGQATGHEDTDDLGDMKVDLESSTANYGQVPHLQGPGGFAP